ncbi:Homeobox-DDT domain protein RLT3 [Vitis vinifera]|uniref:Homeobox-DDT domain protein RLT3 n=1 Tax=Vitis vinifera TaxID=29760 RepID=A0A438FWH4_VITVI|nr:Homeobox-DDT domain protein RLT3 [Vitis vinifera]
MEKFLETHLPGYEVVHEICASPPSLKLASNSRHELGLEILEISTVNPSKESLQRKSSSPRGQEKVQRPFMDEVVEEAIDGAILKVPESNPEGETDKISSIYKVSDEREVQVDGESKIEGNVNGYHSDDVTSDNYMDVLNTMESEMETDIENKPKKKMAKNSPSNGDGVVEVFPCTDICVDEIVDVPPNHLSINEESKPKSHEHVVPNDTCIDVTDVHGYRSEFVEASCTSSPKDLNVMLSPVNCGKSLKEVSVVEPESDGISCDHIKPSTEFSNAVDNETDLGDKLSDASHLKSKEAVICPMYLLGQMMTSSECFAQAQSHPVDESYGGDPNFLSDVLQLMSNAPDLAPEKEKDQLLGSTLSRPLPDCSPASIACDADVKPVCIASEIDANVPENGFNLKNSTPVADMPHTLLLQSSDDSIPETVQAEPVAVAAAAASFGANGEDDFPSGCPNYPDPKDHLSLDDLVTESVPVTCSAHFATNGLHGCSLCKDLLAKFPPNAVKMKQPFCTLRKEALDKELNPMVKYGLHPGTLKGELFSILLNQGNNGMKIPDLARCMQISELNLAGTTEELELLIYSTLSSDITLYEKISSSSYCLRITSHINEAENFQSDTDDSGSIDDDSKDNRKYSSNNDSDSDSRTPNLGKLNYMNHHKQRKGMLTIYTEIDETYPGEVWLLGLVEGEYSDLSIEEKLNALMALVDLVSGGSSIRMA